MPLSWFIDTSSQHPLPIPSIYLWLILLVHPPQPVIHLLQVHFHYPIFPFNQNCVLPISSTATVPLLQRSLTPPPCCFCLYWNISLSVTRQSKPFTGASTLDIPLHFLGPPWPDCLLTRERYAFHSPTLGISLSLLPLSKISLPFLHTCSVVIPFLLCISVESEKKRMDIWVLLLHVCDPAYVTHISLFPQ